MLIINNNFLYKILERIFAYVNIHAKTFRLEKLICGAGNNRLKQISEVVASNIIQLYNIDVKIILNIVSKTSYKKVTPKVEFKK